MTVPSVHVGNSNTRRNRFDHLVIAQIVGYVSWIEDQVSALSLTDRNMQEYRDIQGLLDKIRSTGMGGISAVDPQAVEKLQKKLAGLEKS